MGKGNKGNKDKNNNKDIKPININEQISIKKNDPRYKLLDLLDTTFKETNDSEKLLDFRNSLGLLNDIINQPKIWKWKSKDPILTMFFAKDAMESSQENRKFAKNEDLNYYNFFSEMTNSKNRSKAGKPKIDIDKFILFVKKLTKWEKIEDIIPLSQKTKNTNADRYLEKNLSK